MELLEIEKDLAGPNAETALVRYDATLVTLSGRVQQALRVGVPPDEYDRVEKLDEVVTIARKLLRLQVRSGQKVGRESRSTMEFESRPLQNLRFRLGGPRSVAAADGTESVPPEVLQLPRIPNLKP